MSTTEVILHCQRQLKRVEGEEKLLHYLRRLSRLCIRLKHLQRTGIGKTVNQLARLEGPAGSFAEELVIKWKRVVEEESVEGTTRKSDGKRKRSSSSNEEEEDENGDDEDIKRELEHLQEQYCDEDEDSDDGMVIASPPPQQPSSDDEPPSRVKLEEEEVRVSSSSGGYRQVNPHHSVIVKQEPDSSSEEEQIHHSRVRVKEEPPSSEEEDDSRVHHQVTTIKKEPQEEHRTKSKVRVKEERRRRSSPENGSRVKVKREPESEDGEPPASNHTKGKASHREHRHQTKVKSEGHSKTEEREKSNGRDKPQHRERSSESSSTLSKRRKKDKEEPPASTNQKQDNKLKLLSTQPEIDSTSGLGFEAVLGCLDVVQPSSSSGKKKKKSEKTSGGSEDAGKRRTAHQQQSSKATALKFKLNDSTTLLDPYYRPSLASRLPPPAPKRRNSYQELSLQSADHQLSSMITSRKQKTKVYSGHAKAINGCIPSLFSLCIVKIQDHIEDLGYTGGVPYEILKPVLERATSQQLLQIESFNEYLIESTGELWKFHCGRDFKTAIRDEEKLETWRELYQRCIMEREEKFESARKRVGKSNREKPAERKAKLAYLETSKGPRYGQRKEGVIKNGMRSLKTMEEGQSQRKVKVEEASVVIQAGSRAGTAPGTVSRSAESSPSSSSSKKIKKAPLMQKTFKLMRSLRR